MNFFSRKPKPIEQTAPDQSVRVAELLADKFRLEKEIQDLILKNKNFETRLRVRELIDVKMKDPSPVDGEERALYVAKVAGLHKDILEPKIKQMISSAHSLLEESTNDREFDQSVKGAIYTLWEFLRWGEMMVNEQIANQMKVNPSLEDENNTQTNANNN